MMTDLTTNVGPLTNYGAEFDIVAPLPGGFKFSGGLGGLHATWGDVKNYVNPVNGVPYDNLKGLTVPFAPAYTANTTPEWKHDFGGDHFGSAATGLFDSRSYLGPPGAAVQR